MRLEKYTYDVRNLGQAVGAHKVGASARTSRNTTETLAFRVGSEATMGSLKMLAFLGRAKRLYARACDEGGREGYLKVKAAGIGVNVHNLAREIQPCDQL